jgi:NAD(P)H-hydrate epimerase
MKLADSAQMKALDAHAIHDLGIPSTLLMRNAAEGLLSAVGRAPSGPIAVLCGSGNNGGDGLCAAAGLLLRGRSVRVFFVSDPARLTPDAREMLRRLEELGGTAERYADAPDADSCVAEASVIIDAMLGTGLNAPLRGGVLAAVQAVNASPAYVIAADMPTGVSADTGEILGDAVRADETVTFSLPKIGQFTEPGCTCCGRITVWDIGIPAEAQEAVSCSVSAVTRDDLTLPARDPLAHKGSFGRFLIIAVSG